MGNTGMAEGLLMPLVCALGANLNILHQMRINGVAGNLAF